MDPNKDDNQEKEYDDAFEEASGDNPAVSQDESDFADESGQGGEPAKETASGEEDAGESGAQDDPAAEGDAPAAEGDTGAEDAKAAGEEGAGDEAAAEGAGEEPVADEGKAPATYDEETIRKAAQLLKETAGDQKPAAEGGQEEQEQATDEPDYANMSWEDYLPEDKKSVVDKYKEEWPEVYEAEKAIRDAQLQLIQERLYSDLRGALAPVFETTQKLQVNAHLDTIRQVHPDLDQIRGELNEWIDQQPEFVRPAYKQVAQKGSADQVIQLVNQYKQAKGTASAVPEVPASPARQQQQPAQRKPASKQPSAAAKRALAAAPSPSTADVPGSANPNDYDAAWEEIEAGGLG